MKRYTVAILPGDGIGPEVTEAAVAVLLRAGELFGFEVHTPSAPIGGAAIDAAGDPLPEETLAVCQSADAVLLGAVGGPKWEGGRRPEEGLLNIRRELGVFANLRPAKVWPPLRAASPLKEEVLAAGVDILIVRELTGGIYFGDHGRMMKGKYPAAYDVELYAKNEVERIARVAFSQAMERSKTLVSVDKANVLESSRFWRETVIEIHSEYPEVTLSHMYVDNAAMQLIREPGQFDVVVTSNLFGDILSDEAAMLTGSIGMLPSASIREDGHGLYEPVHGSAPDIAGRGMANPLAAILSAAMLLRLSLDEAEAADAVEAAVSAVLADGLRTPDISGGGPSVSTGEMTKAVLAALR